MTEPDDRRSPLVAQLILVALFGLLIVAGVFTVLIPELSDAAESEDGASSSPDGADETADGTAEAAPPTAPPAD